jgi:uncharacterized protein
MLSAPRVDGELAGYAALFSVADQGNDIIAPGAFRASLARRGAGGIRMLFQHNPAEPIGVWQAITEDTRGLYVRGHLLPSVTRSRELLDLIGAGALDGLSIGFRAVRASRDGRTGARRILEIDLWEISIVTFPMQPAARLVNPAPVKAAGVRHLRAGHQHPPCLTGIRA